MALDEGGPKSNPNTYNCFIFFFNTFCKEFHLVGDDSGLSATGSVC
jgi:hypothetical protein